MKGIYKHYKGGIYKVLGIAKHTETYEDFVVYEAQYPTDIKLWVRPRAMFEQMVIVDGKKVPRFALHKK